MNRNVCFILQFGTLHLECLKLNLIIQYPLIVQLDLPMWWNNDILETFSPKGIWKKARKKKEKSWSLPGIEPRATATTTLDFQDLHIFFLYTVKSHTQQTTNYVQSEHLFPERSHNLWIEKALSSQLSSSDPSYKLDRNFPT